MLENGLYALRFAASLNGEPEEGRGLAVLRDGKVLGSDPMGAVFSGTYEFDARRNLNKVRLQLEIPAGGILITGYTAGPEGASLDVVGAFADAPGEGSAFLQIDGAPLGVQIRYLGPPPT